MTLPHARILEKVGAHRVIFPEHEMGVRLGNALAGTNLIDYMELDPRYAVAEIRCPIEIAGRTLAEANVRGRYGVIVLCVKTGDEVDVIPDADKRLEKARHHRRGRPDQEHRQARTAGVRASGRA